MTAGPASSGAAPGSGRSYGWRLASIAGVPVYLGRSWPLIAAVIVASYGPLFGRIYDDLLVGLVFGLAFAVLLLLSVLAHEAAHALMARRFGHQVDRVVADLFGGHTVYDSSSTRPGTSAAIAVVGPAANLVLAGVAYAAGGLVSDGGVLGVLLDTVMRTNLFVGLFNLVPGLPLDGGFLVDSLVWKLTGDRNKGLIVAGWLGRLVTLAVGFLFVGRPLLLGQRPSLFVIVWCGLIGAFLWVGASNAIRTGTARRVIAGVPLASVLRPAVLTRGSEPLAGVLPRLGDRGAADAPLGVVLGPSGRPVGLVDIEAAGTVDRARWADVPVEALMRRQPDGWVVVVPDREVGLSELVAAIPGRADQAPPTMVAVTPAGEVLGTVTLTDLYAAFAR